MIEFQSASDVPEEYQDYYQLMHSTSDSIVTVLQEAFSDMPLDDCRKAVENVMISLLVSMHLSDAMDYASVHKVVQKIMIELAHDAEETLQ